MKARQDEQAKVTAAREEARKRREGADYKTPEERASSSRAIKSSSQQVSEDSNDSPARVVEGDDGKFDPHVDYYAVLDLPCSAASKEIVAAYRKAALGMHPDKYKNESEEQQAAIAKKFQEVSKAYRVLQDEEMRGAYDKCRDYMQANPDKPNSLPIASLTKEEQAMVMRGAGELSRLKRMGPKLKKHDDLQQRVVLTLEELHFGCTKEVAVARQRVDYSGKRFVSEKVFHLVVKRGTKEGCVMRFEGEGEETVDTHAGDLVFVVGVAPHPVWRRCGERGGLEVFVNVYEEAAAEEGGEGEDDKTSKPGFRVFSVIELETIGRKQCTLVLRGVYEALVRGGCGGTWERVVVGQGLFDGVGRPAGDLKVSARFLPLFLEEARVRGGGRVRGCVREGGVLVLGGSEDVVGASVLGGWVVHRVRHRIEAGAMIEGGGGGEGGRRPRVLVIDICGGDGSSFSAPSSASLDALRRIFDASYAACTVVSVDPHRGLLDDAVFATSAPFDVVVLNHAVLRTSSSSTNREATMASVRTHMTDVMALVGLHHMRGADIVAIEGAVELLGRGRGVQEEEKPSYTPILPFYQLRAGGSTNNAGFDDVIAAIAADQTTHATCVGVLDGSAYTIDPITGEAEMIIAPHRDALVKKAAWDDGDANEADDDFGFIVAYTS